MAATRPATPRSDHQAPLERAAWPVLRLQFQDPNSIFLRLRHNFLSSLGGAGFTGTGAGGGGELEPPRAAGRPSHEPAGNRRAMGLPIWLGARASSGCGGFAQLWLRGEGQSPLFQVPLHRSKEFSTRWDDSGEV